MNRDAGHAIPYRGDPVSNAIDDAPIVCTDLTTEPDIRNPSAMASDRRIAARRWIATIRRRMRRLVRAVLRATRGVVARSVRRGVPGWRHRRIAVREGAALCAATQCRYHLTEFFTGRRLHVACALVVADRGSHTQEDVAEMVGLSHAAISSIERGSRVKRRMASVAAAWFPVSPTTPPIRDPTEQRVAHALRCGRRRTAADVALVTGMDVSGVRDALNCLLSRGVVATTGRVRGRNIGAEWWIATGDDVAANEVVETTA